MKTTDVFFKSSNFIGREIENVQDLVKALAAGMDIATDEECGYSTIGEREVADEDGTTRFEEYDKTEEELFNEMKSDLDDKRTLYAGFFLNSREYSVEDAKATTLQSDFHVGQEVYFMKDNKIQSKFIFRIMLNSVVYYDGSEDNTKIVDGENKSIELSHNKSNIYILASKRYYKSMSDRKCISYGHMEAKKEDEIFATKEELVKHLMEE